MFFLSFFWGIKVCFVVLWVCVCVGTWKWWWLKWREKEERESFQVVGWV